MSSLASKDVRIHLRRWSVVTCRRLDVKAHISVYAETVRKHGRWMLIGAGTAAVSRLSPNDDDELEVIMVFS